MNAEIEFSTVLPSLISLYRMGTLVPFIGSGMSRDTCTGWTEFLTRLAKETGIALPEPLRRKSPTNDSAALYRLADTVVHALRELPPNQRIKISRTALLTTRGRTPVPDQTAALARLYWPLVVTTNYDDLYWSASSNESKPEIMGRSISDCHRVLRSLDESLPPILWALQGFIGGQRESPATVLHDELRREHLASQLVIGHQQYQQAINSDHHFRRAFAEVYRRRSLLFMGSGILEDYLVNLFSEIVHHHGRGRHPHFALIAESDRHRYDPWFLQFRLGIVPIFYADHRELPKILDQLAAIIHYRGEQIDHRKLISAAPDSYGFTLHRPVRGPLRLTVSRTQLPLPDSAKGECSVVSLGRINNIPQLGGLAASHLNNARQSGVAAQTDEWIPLDEAPSYAFRFGQSPIFGAAARDRKSKGKEYDRRDLGCIPDAVVSVLNFADHLGFTTVQMGPIASGPARLWHPIHPFAQMLAGIRQFALSDVTRNIRTIHLHIVDRSVWYPISAGKLPLLELLSSDVATRHLEFTDREGVTDHISLTLKVDPSLDEFLRISNVRREYWNIRLLPGPDDGLGVEPPGDTIVTSTMTVSLTPKFPAK